jgi:hypothetical protein
MFDEGFPVMMKPWENEDGSKETRETLSQYYCGIQRLVIDCPFADVRRSCRRFLDRANVYAQLMVLILEERS